MADRGKSRSYPTKDFSSESSLSVSYTGHSEQADGFFPETLERVSDDDSTWEGVVEISATTPSTDTERFGHGEILDQRNACVTKEQFQEKQGKIGERRSKSVPRQSCQGEILHPRSKSVAKEHLQDRLKTLSRPRTDVYKKLAELKALLEAEQLQECSFKPTVGRKPDPESPHFAPIFERIVEIQQRHEYRKRKGLEMVDVADRLSCMQTSFHQDCKHEYEKKKSTFTPAINENTDYIIASSKQFGGFSVGFFQRQQKYQHALEEKKKLKEHEVPSDLTFHPHIGNSTFILKQSLGNDVFQETALERFERLAYRDKEQLQHARAKVAENYYAQFNFQPDIDGFSRFLACQTSIDDLHQVNTREYKNTNGNLPSIIYQRRKERKEKAHSEQESRTHKELQELKECTFKPRVNTSAPRETPPAHIKGFERHLDLQNIAKQMKRDQEELERRMFFSHVYTMPTRQYTIPRPFLLQTAQQAARRRAVMVTPEK